MGQAKQASATDRINYVNIGLMLISCAVALYIPFELFLFAYAVLGPAHYLTEISWLEKRSFFTRGKHDYWLLAALALLLFLTAAFTGQNFSPQVSFNTAVVTFLALGSALVLVLTRSFYSRVIGLAVVAVLAFASLSTVGFLVVLLATFVPTLIHVYLFTGFFILYGALKERSRTGYLSFAVFLLCPVACLLIDPRMYTPSAYAAVSYFRTLAPVNLTLLGISTPHSSVEAANVGLQLLSHRGLALMRFIAFAYTYHYFNWFSKTSIIRWHEVGTRRIVGMGALWAASVGIYLYDFSLGAKVLFCLSLMHVYLEFPLNHVSIMGTYREVRSMFQPQVQPALATAGKGAAAARVGRQR